MQVKLPRCTINIKNYELQHVPVTTMRSQIEITQHLPVVYILYMCMSIEDQLHLVSYHQ